MVRRIIWAAVASVMFLFVVDQFKPSLLHWPHLPSAHGSTKASSDTHKVTDYFQSLQGMVAGKTFYQGIDIHLTHQSVSFLPTWVAGSCLTLHNGQGAVTYYSDWKSQPPTVQQTGNGELVTIPDPVPVSVGITAFDQGSVSTNWHCGLVVKSQPDVQGANAQLMSTLCSLAKTDQTHLAERRADVTAAIQQAMGPGVQVAWIPAHGSTPKECQ